MPWQKGDSETARMGGVGRVQKREQWENLINYLAGDAGESVKKKLLILENGEKISKPEHEFLAYWLNLLEYHAPKLARVENKIEGKLDVNLVSEFEEVKKQ